LAARKLTSAASAANAVCDHMHDWFVGTVGDYVSMAVVSDGSYDVPKGLVFSFPVTCKDGTFKIVPGLKVR
jgi:malate/lactate dehydrogenase